MSGTAMIRALLAAATLIATQAQAGRDIPPPRAIHPIPPVFADAARWRETPAVMQGWSDDRHVPVVGLDRMSACEARARMGAMAAAEDWTDDGDILAGFDGDDVAPDWETMR